MSNLTIYVTGQACQGKTTLANIIAKCLAENGFTDVQLNSPDSDGYPIEHLDKCKQALIDKGITIAINEVQTLRNPME